MLVEVACEELVRLDIKLPTLLERLARELCSVVLPGRHVPLPVIHVRGQPGNTFLYAFGQLCIATSAALETDYFPHNHRAATAATNGESNLMNEGGVDCGGSTICPRKRFIRIYNLSIPSGGQKDIIPSRKLPPWTFKQNIPRNAIIDFLQGTI